MHRYDRYVLSQYLLFFGFFALILVTVFWINRAVGLFDQLIGDGQSAMVFLEFTALILPTLIRTVMPISVFGAVAYVTNRLSRESEMTVMQAVGSSSWRLARPAFALGLVAALMMAILTNVLRPASLAQLDLREAEVAQNVTARLLKEGSFMHPDENVTFYIRQIDPDGTLRDLYLSDRRDPAREVIYNSAEAYLVRSGDRASLVMVDGIAQQLNRNTRTMSVTQFADFSYDISSMMSGSDGSGTNLRALPTLDLIFRADDYIGTDGITEGRLVEELHQRFAWATICLAVAMVAYSTLTLGSYSRFGLWPQALGGFVFLIMLEVLRGAVSSPVLKNADLWPLLYVPTLIGLALSGVFMTLAGRPVRILLAGIGLARLPEEAADAGAT
ncbi:LPS export ABC transporter permease LptF [Chachezhania sediminis]|uniref:LPS export ABC transporter permease LptF n=1 Tax=Chachezhania sediminis TaxID=2599291 RepID=UPI00131B5E42|nr:LPS export ABC transporter permease LptF [Chachezhania sediminis]